MTIDETQAALEQHLVGQPFLFFKPTYPDTLVICCGTETKHIHKNHMWEGGTHEVLCEASDVTVIHEKDVYVSFTRQQRPSAYSAYETAGYAVRFVDQLIKDQPVPMGTLVVRVDVERYATEHKSALQPEFMGWGLGLMFSNGTVATIIPAGPFGEEYEMVPDWTISFPEDGRTKFLRVGPGEKAGYVE